MISKIKMCLLMTLTQSLKGREQHKHSHIFSVATMATHESKKHYLSYCWSFEILESVKTANGIADGTKISCWLLCTVAFITTTWPTRVDNHNHTVWLPLNQQHQIDKPKKSSRCWNLNDCVEYNVASSDVVSQQDLNEPQLALIALIQNRSVLYDKVWCISLTELQHSSDVGAFVFIVYDVLRNNFVHLYY